MHLPASLRERRDWRRVDTGARGCDYVAVMREGQRLLFRGSLATVASIVVVSLTASAAGAATISVNTTTDTVTGSQCSLRAAIAAANTDTSVAGCPAGMGTDTIVLPAGLYTLAIPPSGADGESSGDLNVTSNLTIEGGGAATTTLDGAGLDRVFAIANGATVTISGLTVTGGQAEAGGDASNSGAGPPEPDSEGIGGGFGQDGGGILDEGVLTLIGDVVTGNHAGVGGHGGNAPDGATGVEVPHQEGITACQGGHSIGGSGGQGGSGGGIEVDNGYLMLESTQVIDNDAGRGGDGGNGGNGGAALGTGSCAGNLGGSQRWIQRGRRGRRRGQRRRDRAKRHDRRAERDRVHDLRQRRRRGRRGRHRGQRRRRCERDAFGRRGRRGDRRRGRLRRSWRRAAGIGVPQRACSSERL